jgi:CTP synthase (UTP-ammonia lyase)
VTAVRIALVGDFDPAVTAHRAIPDALLLAGMSVGVPVTWEWIGTERLEHEVTDPVRSAHGIWVVPNSPYRSEAGAIAAIRFAREKRRPFLGTCAGFQHAVLEHARHEAGLPRAAHAELDPTSDEPVISALACGLVEVSGDVLIEPDSRLARAYGGSLAVEPYHCNYGLNPRYQSLLHGGPLRVTARDAEGAVRAVEREGEAFFVATLFQPERAALAARAHPVVNAFVAAAAA